MLEKLKEPNVHFQKYEERLAFALGLKSLESHMLSLCVFFLDK